MIVLRGYGKLADDEAGAGMVMPLLLPDAPVVAWWPSEAPAVPSADPVGLLAQRRITDALSAKNPTRAFEQRRASYVAGDTDLTWTRLTPWRALLATALDAPPHDPVTSAVVAGELVSPSTDLMAGWLAERLGVKVKRSPSKCGPGLGSVSLERRAARSSWCDRTARSAGCASPASPTGWSRWRAARCATASRRSCAASIPTRSTVPRWRASLRSAGAARRSPDHDGRQHDRADHDHDPRSRREPGGALVVSGPEIVVHAQSNILASAAAARLITRLVDIQAAGSVPKLVLTGGGVGIAMLEQVRATVARDAVDWGEVEFYWGDERFLPPGDPERNDTQARAALLDHVRVDPAKVYPMGADTGTGPPGAEAAAEEYATLLASKAQPEDHGPVPGLRRAAARHGRRGAHGVGVPALPRGVRDRARGRRGARLPEAAAHARVAHPSGDTQGAEVWIITTGDSKAGAVALALGGAGEVAIPVAGARGKRRTLWLLDRAAAAKLPRDLVPPIA